MAYDQETTDLLKENERLKKAIKGWISELPTTDIAFSKWEQLQQQGAVQVGVLFEKHGKRGVIDNFGKVVWLPNTINNRTAS